MQFDTTALPGTKGKPVPWWDRLVAVIWVRATGQITFAQGVEEKRTAVNDARPDDCLLVAWPGQWRQDIFVLDAPDEALAGLLPPRQRT